MRQGNVLSPLLFVIYTKDMEGVEALFLWTDDATLPPLLRERETGKVKGERQTHATPFTANRI